MDLHMDLQLFGGVTRKLFGGGGGGGSSVQSAPSVKNSAPGSVATQTAEDNGTRKDVRKRLRRGLLTDKTQGALAGGGAAQMVKTLLGQ